LSGSLPGIYHHDVSAITTRQSTTPTPTTPLFSPPSPFSLSSGISVKIPPSSPLNPYEVSSVDRGGTRGKVYVDEATELEYPIDLGSVLYSGTTAEEVATPLLGLGQYTRTVFKVKVYGVALYGNAQQMRSDEGLVGRFGWVGAEEMQGEEGFYRCFYEMGCGPPSSSSEGDINVVSGGGEAAAGFDRSLMLKLNMQLSTSTMRNSLSTDWKLLTPEHKLMLITSSFEPRPATSVMTERLRKGEGSRCSCGQVPPPDVSADHGCCARGTELLFTWRQNGNFEVRLDGRVMDVFEGRSDLAMGIFYE